MRALPAASVIALATTPEGRGAATVAAAASVDDDRSTRAGATAAVLGGYQPVLDGIRAVAIVMVLLFHTIRRNRSMFASGYLGVDAFFVLSGFLITTLLLQEARAGAM